MFNIIFMSLTFDIYLFLPNKIFAYAKQNENVFAPVTRNDENVVQVMYRPMIYSKWYYIVFVGVFIMKIKNRKKQT